MKKSRIIVPALAMLTLSVAASVTGTVAWFTASRTANMTLNNLVAIDTAGSLSMSLENVNAKEISGNTIELQALRDFSYDANKEKGYIASFDTDGTKVTGTKMIDPCTARFGSFGNPATEVYYVNSFNATFSTSASAKSYLYFNNNHDKSKLSIDYSDPSKKHTESIYRALRVSMKAIDSRKSGATTKIVTWAPYTSLNEDAVLNVTKAAEIKNGGVNVNTAVSKTTYVDASDESIVDTTPNVVKKAAQDPVVEGDSITDATKSKLLLSSELISGITVKVNFVIWFEGLDPVCLSGKQDTSTIADQTAETISMGFYAIPETTFGPARA